MNICFISKYPPIQGGVSMHCYWAARGLAERGHRVIVVTNANEVETTFRIKIAEEHLAPGAAYAPTFDSGGSVRVVSTEPPDRTKLYYIPLGNPTSTRLSALATDVVREEECDVIFSYYLEPYGLASHLTSQWTHVPYVFKHAGSDLHRLFDIADLKTAYLEVLLGASRIISHGPSRQKLIDHGVDPRRICSDVAFGIPTDFFHPGVPGHQLTELLATSGRSPADVVDKSMGADPGTLPILGFYGKLGEYKGSFDLLVAAAELIKSGFPILLVGLSHGWQEARFVRLAAELGIEDYLYLLPFLPHWEVPTFIRSCTAVCFLERDFPIAAHTPTIPQEIIACGTPLVLSDEVARKQMFRASIRNRRNLVVVSDPKNHEELASALRFILEDPGRAAAIGSQGLVDFGTGHPHDAYVTGLESVLEQAASERPSPARTRSSTATGFGVGPRQDPIELLPRLFPYTAALLTVANKEALRKRVAGTALGSEARDRITLGVQFGVQLEAALADVPGTPELVTEICRYERRLYDCFSAETSPAHPSPAPAPAFTLDEIGQLYPRLLVPVDVVDFAIDIDMVIAALDSNDRQPNPGDPCQILFHPCGLPLRVNTATALLIDWIREGDVAVSEILARSVSLLSTSSGQKLLEASLISTLESLYWEGLIDLVVAPKTGSPPPALAGDRSSSELPSAEDGSEEVVATQLAPN